MPDDGRARCEWAGGDDPLMRAYHDEEWGVPLHDDRALFELLTLEGAQAGLSWRTVLHRREGYRAAFGSFDIGAVARLDAAAQAALLLDARIIRNRAKIASTVTNAQAIEVLRAEVGSFDAYLWSFVDGQPLRRGYRALAELPAATDESHALSRELRRRGFRFVGPTICYALMQSAGLVNDHTADCFRYDELGG
ncbi:MAG: DNA-3-methyladenine glycosylase I [Dehalococcoidia bacterium]|nr:DNA-3-methyladenine glycosylase I [Dehalococcoidia bacterium]